jgi:DNA-binding SARP family transcriptional activator
VSKGPAVPAREKSSPRIEIFFFGKFRVAAGDQVLDEEAWITRKAKSLFAYLSSRLGEAESEERLMELFWLEGSTNARHALHNCITVIRKIFSPFLADTATKIILKKKIGYYLNREPGCRIDLEEFQGHFHRGRALFEKGAFNDGLLELQMAERLYTGPFMEGSYDEWSDGPRLVTRNNFLELMHILGKYFFEKEKYQVSVDYWKKALVADNCFEDAYLGLMLSHVAMENRNEAIKIYHQCVQTLKKELDLAPPPKLMEIYYKTVEGQKVPLIL